MDNYQFSNIYLGGFMKNIALVFALMFVFAASAIAQTAVQQTSAAGNGANFRSPQPQFLSFSLGVPLGYDLDVKEMTAGYNFGIGFMLMDDFQVGYDFLALENKGKVNNAIANNSMRNFNAIRLAYNFTPQVGTALGVGLLENLAESTSGISLGVFSNIVQKRSAIGVAYGLKVRMDYVAPTKYFGRGMVLFTTGFNFGL